MKTPAGRFARKPGKGWRAISGAVWEHSTGIRIHLIGLALLSTGESIPWGWADEIHSLRQQGFNKKRALMVWALSLKATPFHTILVDE